MVNKIDLLSDGEFIDLIKDSSCVSDVLKALGYSTNGNSWGTKIVKERMEKLHISFTKKNKNYFGNNSSKLALENVMTKDSSYCRTKLKDRLFKEGIKEYKCECCGISEWQGKPISLQLHHINGINNDNRLSNLQILCPNCHSQTDNYAGTKGKGLKVITKCEMLPEEDKEKIMNTVREVGIVEARKQLTYRNSLINSVVKNYKERVVMLTPKGETKEFGTTVEVAMYMYNELGLGTSVEAVRSAVSKCICGQQKTTQGGYRFYRRSTGEE